MKKVMRRIGIARTQKNYSPPETSENDKKYISKNESAMST